MKRERFRGNIKLQKRYGPGGGGLPYERGGDARQNFWIKPLKETNLGVAQPFFEP